MSNGSELKREQTTKPVCVITPHNGFEAISYATRALVGDFQQSRALAWRMLLRDIRAMYRQSLLGYFWLFLPPLATVFVWVFPEQHQLGQCRFGWCSVSTVCNHWHSVVDCIQQFRDGHDGNHG